MERSVYHQLAAIEDGHWWFIYRRRLMAHMIDNLRRLGARRIFLEVRPDNHAAVRLYEKFGFVPCRRLENYYGHGHPALRMLLDQSSHTA